MQLTGAEIVMRCLHEEKVDYVFGYPGGSVLFIYDELFKQDKFNMFWFAMNRQRFMPQMPIPDLRARSAFVW